ncbi:MAG TPA: hypothetical protein VI977_02885 [archaeon]|nr:hypothetical protein [archaeon]
MDTFTFMIAVVLMMLAIQFQQNWMVLAIVTVLVLTTRSVKATIVLGIAAFVLYFAADSLKEIWPLVLFGLVILSIILGVGKKEQEQMPMDMGMGMDGGMGGFGGPGGY